jgi:hypothetical protein
MREAIIDKTEGWRGRLRRRAELAVVPALLPGPLIIAIEDRGVGHWIATHGWWLADVKTRGRWVEWDDHGLHADAPVETVWIEILASSDVMFTLT